MPSSNFTDQFVSHQRRIQRAERISQGYYHFGEVVEVSGDYGRLTVEVVRSFGDVAYLRNVINTAVKATPRTVSFVTPQARTMVTDSAGSYVADPDVPGGYRPFAADDPEKSVTYSVDEHGDRGFVLSPFGTGPGLLIWMASLPVGIDELLADTADVLQDLAEVDVFEGGVAQVATAGADNPNAATAMGVVEAAPWSRSVGGRTFRRPAGAGVFARDGVASLAAAGQIYTDLPANNQNESFNFYESMEGSTDGALQRTGGMHYDSGVLYSASAVSATETVIEQWTQAMGTDGDGNDVYTYAKGTDGSALSSLYVESSGNEFLGAGNFVPYVQGGTLLAQVVPGAAPSVRTTDLAGSSVRNYVMTPGVASQVREDSPTATLFYDGTNFQMLGVDGYVYSLVLSGASAGYSSRRKFGAAGNEATVDSLRQIVVSNGLMWALHSGHAMPYLWTDLSAVPDLAVYVPRSEQYGPSSSVEAVGMLATSDRLVLKVLAVRREWTLLGVATRAAVRYEGFSIPDLTNATYGRSRLQVTPSGVWAIDGSGARRL